MQKVIEMTLEENTLLNDIVLSLRNSINSRILMDNENYTKNLEQIKDNHDVLLTVLFQGKENRLKNFWYMNRPWKNKKDIPNDMIETAVFATKEMIVRYQNKATASTVIEYYGLQMKLLESIYKTCK